MCIIPARGGSKRIPRKNIKPFRGVPLISRTIGTMRASDCFDRVVVSTDDDEIAKIARAAGAEVPFLRPAELSDDTTGTGAVIRHAIAELEAEGPSPDFVCLVYPGAVFVTVDDICASFEQLTGSDVDYVFAATEFAAPIQRALRVDEAGRAAPVWPEHLMTRSQDLEPRFHDTGQFYWGRRAAWVAAVPVMTGTSEIYEIPNWRVHDIDTPDDWRRGEILFDLIQHIE